MDQFNWSKELDEAILNNPSDDSWEILTNQAKSWGVLATSTNLIPKTSQGIPMDLNLAILGIKFNWFIIFRCWNTAKKILIKIENRNNFLVKKFNLK